jgi:hypothetical protein
VTVLSANFCIVGSGVMREGVCAVGVCIKCQFLLDGGNGVMGGNVCGWCGHFDISFCIVGNGVMGERRECCGVVWM